VVAAPSADAARNCKPQERCSLFQTSAKETVMNARVDSIAVIATNGWTG
jgi:hypothetical protein